MLSPPAKPIGSGDKNRPKTGSYHFWPSVSKLGLRVRRPRSRGQLLSRRISLSRQPGPAGRFLRCTCNGHNRTNYPGPDRPSIIHEIRPDGFRSEFRQAANRDQTVPGNHRTNRHKTLILSHFSTVYFLTPGRKKLKIFVWNGVWRTSGG